jgi:Spy/CpxP family protein refolding chaperone
MKLQPAGSDFTARCRFYRKELMMPRLVILPLLLAVIAANCNKGSATEPKAAAAAETKYLLFQVWPRMPGYPGIQPLPGHMTLSKEQMAEFVQSVVKAIGTTGDARHKLGFAVGPFCFDISDAETRQWIRDAFAVARENDVAVAIHIDDSMSWGRRKDLLSNPDNIETADWKQIPNAARSLAWGPKPTEFPPQMCYNAPAIVSAAKDRAALIGAEIKRELAVLQAQGKQHLFAGVIAGSETQIGPEFRTNRRLGFRALAHRGFSENSPPKDIDAERVSVVKEWIELWCHSLQAAGAPREKIFCHIAFTDQGLRKADAKESYVEKVAFAPPEVAFSSAYRPGFSTYPEGRTFKEVYAALADHGSPGWISAEGTNVSPTSMPGEPNMETYLARIFNHGGVLVNVFSWGMGGEALRNNFFRRATESPECLTAYAKFLRGEALVEATAQSFSAAFQEKMHRIQAELPNWIQKTGRQTEAMPLIHSVMALIKERKWQEADKVADELLALISAGAKTGTASGGFTIAAFQDKMRRIQEALPDWENSGRQATVMPLMQKLSAFMKKKQFEEADKVADELLALPSAATRSDTATPRTHGTADEEARAHFLHDLGGPFFVSRDKVQADLKLSDEQKHKLRETMTGYVQETMEVQKLSGAERKQAMQSLRQKSYKELDESLKEILTPEQLKRFAELKLQYDMPMIMLQPDIVKELNITDEQRQQFMTLIQEMQKVVVPLIQGARSGGNPQEILAKVTKLRLDCQGKIEALLSDAQKTQWKEMTGTPLVIW